MRDLAVGIVLSAGAAFAGFFLVRLLFQYILPKSIPAWAAENSCYAGGILAMFLTVRFLHRWGVTRDLRRKLVAAGVPVCIGCGYKLVGLPARTRDLPGVRAITRTGCRSPAGGRTGTLSSERRRCDHHDI